MKTMLTVLADKFNIDRSYQTWEVELFNMLCSATALDAEIKQQSINHTEDIARLTSELTRLAKSESLILNTLAGVSVSGIFKEKVRALMKESGLKISFRNKIPIISPINFVEKNSGNSPIY